MLVKEVKKDKKHFMSVLFEDGQTLLLDKDVCIQNALKPGIVLSNEKVAELEYESEYTRAKSRALWHLDRSDYTEKAIFEKLCKAGFDKRVSAAVISRLVELGVIDDNRFAQRFAERCAESNVSKRETFRKMLEKGVPYDLTKNTLENLETDEMAQLKEIIERRYAYKLSQPGGLQKVYAALVRKGFSYSGVKSALKKYSEDLEFGEEF